MVKTSVMGVTRCRICRFEMGNRIPVRGVLANRLWATRAGTGTLANPEWYIARSRPQRGLNREWPRTELKKSNAFNEGQGRGSPPRSSRHDGSPVYI
jgi:hypothetical protein